MQDRRVGRRYAKALFQAATAAGVVDSVESDLSMIVNLIENDDRFRYFIAAPFSSSEEKIGLAERVFSDRITALTMQVLRVILNRRREDALTEIFHEYVTLRRIAQGTTFVTITSVEALDDTQRAQLVDKLKLRMKGEVEAEYKVDPRLIGGVRVSFGNSTLDGSVRGALNRLRERLMYDLLKQA